jgi:inosose dehydratase
MPELGSENTFQQTISEMALAGFTGCEIGSKYPQTKKNSNGISTSEA